MSDSKKIPIYQEIFNDLYDKIIAGALKTGDKIPTEKELMNQYSISRITASRAVLELEKLGYIKRMKAVGSFVTPRSQWKDSDHQEEKAPLQTISVVFPAPSSGLTIEMDVLQGIQEACRSKGYGLSIHSNKASNHDIISPFEFEKKLVSEIIEQKSAGSIIFPFSTYDSPETYNMMMRRSFPFVLIDRHVFGIDAPIVTSENKEGFSSMVDYVISRGHTKIAFVSGNTYRSSCRSERFSGYLNAMNNNKLKVEDRFIIHNLLPENFENLYFEDLEEKEQIIRKSIKKMLNSFLNLQEPPTVIMASNDYIALNIMSVASELGIKIPDDVSITGFDNLSVNSFIYPKLTTVTQDFLKIGQTAVDLLDKIIKNPQKKLEQIKIPTGFMKGDTVKELHKPKF